MRSRLNSRPIYFVHIQKTGGESVRGALGLPRNEPDKHRTARERRDAIGAEAWHRGFSFAFVRNPWDRMVSWWSMIDEMRPAEYTGKEGNRFQRYVWERAATFEEFVVNCTETIHDADGDKSIVRPQLEYLIGEDGEMLVDFVGRYERLAADFAVVAERIDRRNVALPWKNRSSHSDYRGYYTDELAALVAARARPDLEAFGYRFDNRRA